MPLNTVRILEDFLLNLYVTRRLEANNDYHMPLKELQACCLDWLRAQHYQNGEKLPVAQVFESLTKCIKQYLCQTPQAPEHWRFDVNKLAGLYEQKIIELDKAQIKQTSIAKTLVKGRKPTIAELLEEYKPIGNSQPLQYQRTKTEKIKPRCELRWRSKTVYCHLCQRILENQEKIDYHFKYHNERTNFKFLNTMKKLEKPKTRIYAQRCKSHNFLCFTLKTKLQNICLDKIILVHEHSFTYVEKEQIHKWKGAAITEDEVVKYEEIKNEEVKDEVVKYEDVEDEDENVEDEYVDDEDMEGEGDTTFYKFLLDCRLFLNYQVIPVVVVFKDNLKAVIRHVEQHHLMIQELPPGASTVMFKTKIGLPQFKPLENIRKALKEVEFEDELKTISSPFKEYCDNDKTLTKDNLTKVLSIMLQIEDVDSVLAYETLEESNVKLTALKPPIFSAHLRQNLENGLSANDEILIIRNTRNLRVIYECFELFFVEKTGNETRRMAIESSDQFCGKVKRIRDNLIVFYCPRLTVKAGDKYTLLFPPDRTIIRYQYYALHLLNKCGEFQRICFPEPSPSPSPTLGEVQETRSSWKLQNEAIRSNPEQLAAIDGILESTTLQAPFIVFGPPGTGKTTTIVEAIWQLIVSRPTARIIIMSACNAACDEIALRLLKIVESEATIPELKKLIYRVYAKNQDIKRERIAPELIRNSNLRYGYILPSIQTLHEYRVIACTLSMSAKLNTGNFGRTDFNEYLYTHIFVDEAPFATETETMMGIVHLLSPKVKLTLSGDHKQLGAVLESSRAEKLGLALSLMERLLGRACYAVSTDGVYDKRFQSRLRRNYRSHPAIVANFNQLYYNDEMLALARPENVCRSEKWHLLPNTAYPIVFHSVTGYSETEQFSTSLHNSEELDIVMNYVRGFMYVGIGGTPLQQNDIGIISPYKKQCVRINGELKMRGWFNIECNTVELFQGNEKEVIIVSFVRSNSETIGFLNNKKRLNVVLSRPKSLLIMIGNPVTLMKFSDLRFVIENCVTQGSVVGDQITLADIRRARNAGGISEELAELTLTDNELAAIGMF